MKKGKIKSKLRYVPAIVALGTTVLCGTSFANSISKVLDYREKIEKLEAVMYGEFKDEEEANIIISYVLRDYFGVEPSQDYLVNYRTATLLHKSLTSEKDEKNDTMDWSGFGLSVGVVTSGFLVSAALERRDKELKKEVKEDVRSLI